MIKKIYTLICCWVIIIATGFMVRAENECNYENGIYIEKRLAPIPVDLLAKDNGVVHIFSHGRSGQLLLNNKWRNAAEIVEFIKQHHLLNTRTRKLYIYGCEFGKGADGRSAVAYLQKMLHVSVAASDDITGKDGDWVLEVGAPVCVKGLESYSGNLQYAAGDDFDGDGILNAADIDDDNDGILDAVEAPACYYTPAEAAVISTVSTGVAGSTVNSVAVVAGNDITTMHDGVTTSVTASNHVIAANQLGSTATIIYKIRYPTAVSLTQVVVNTATASWGTGAFAILEGSTDDVNYTALSVPVAISAGTAKTWPVTLNTANLYTYYRIRVSTVGTTQPAFTVYEVAGTLNTTGYAASAHPKPSCTADLDGDGVLNQFDRDSDGDGCPDAKETGTYNKPGVTVIGDSVISNTMGGNGFAIVLRSAADTNTYNYTYTYDYATSKFYNACADFDGDGITDIVDIDDDNDGILDAAESPDCYYTSTEAAVITSVSTGVTTSTVNSVAITSGSDIPTMHDGVTTTVAASNHVFAANQLGTTSTVIYKIQYPTAVGLSQVVVNTATANWGTGAFAVLEGSTDEINYTAISAPVAISTGAAKTWPVTLNTSNLYTFYRIRVSTVGTTQPAFTTFEVTGTVNTATYGPSAHPKISCFSDIDGDGIINQLDLDSDGDGCPDAKEASVSGTLQTGTLINTSGSTPNVPNSRTAGPYGNNGLANAIETNDLSTAQTSYTSACSYCAIVNTSNACLDSDGDGIADLFDIDDDNDGVLDVNEGTTLFCDQTYTLDSRVIWNTFTGTPSTITGALTKNGKNVTVTATASNGFNALRTTSWNIAGTAYSGCPSPFDVLANSVINIFTSNYTITFNFSQPVANPVVILSSFDGSVVNFGSTVYVLGAQAGSTATAGSMTTSYAPQENAGSFVFPGVYSSISFTVPGSDNQGSVILSIDSIMPAGAMTYQASSYAPDYLDIYTDGDGLPNRLDLDSDGDGCPDAVEAGVAANGGASGSMSASGGTIYSGGITSGTANAYVGNGTPSQYGANGFFNNIETSTESGIYNSGYFYFYATSSFMNACTDSDGDGIKDVVDIDDDNDGILDAVEAPSCYYTTTEAAVITSVSTSVTGSTENLIAIIPGSDIANMHDGVTVGVPSFNHVFAANQLSSTSTVIYKIQYPTAVSLTQLAVYTATANWGTGAFAVLEGSTDDVTYTAVSNPIAISTGTLKTWPVTLNTTNLYIYYRIRIATVGSTQPAFTNYEVAGTLNTTNYIASIHPKITCSTDTDGDGILNQLDKDSDGDGCPDAKEAGTYNQPGVAFTGDSVLVNTTVVNGNGFADALQSVADTNAYKSSYTYYYATNNTLNFCIDSDGDGINDVTDIDDDNDGITDTQEMACPTGGAPLSGTNISITDNNEVSYSENSPQVIIDFSSSFQNFNVLFWSVDYQDNFTVSAQLDDGSIVGPLNGRVFFSTSDPSWVSRWTAKGYPVASSDANWNQQLGKYTGAPFGATDVFYTSPITNNNNKAWGAVQFTVPQATPVNGIDKIILTILPGIGVTAFAEVEPLNILSGCVDLDTDGDGIPNRLDLDSDGDGCADLKEAGVSPATDIITPASAINNVGVSYGIANANLSGSQLNPAAADANNDGLNDSVDPDMNGVINYVSSYNPYALAGGNWNTCSDVDGDGINDLVDIDDDNDGVLDAVEAASCYYSLSEAGTIATVTTALSNDDAYNADLPFMHDGVTTTVTASNNIITQAFNGDIVYTISYPTAINLTSVSHYGTTFGTAATGMIYGSKDMINWDSLMTAPTAATANPKIFTINKNAANSYRYYRIVKAAGNTQPAITTYEVSAVQNTTPYIPSANPKSICSIDTDGDGITNNKDLDSDGDGCPDARESGVSGNSGASGSMSPSGGVLYSGGIASGTANAYVGNGTPSQYGANGFFNGLEVAAESGTYNGTYTYSQYAVANNLNLCADTDNDGVPDIVDIDDDNDGILDAVESPSCFYTSAEIAIPALVTTAVATTGTIANIYDNSTTTFGFTNASTKVNTTVFEITPNYSFAGASLQIEMNTTGQTAFSNTAASLLMQGWNGTSWDTLMPPFNPSASPNTVSGFFQTFTFTQNLTNAYSKFRLQGLAGTVTASLMREIKIIAPANYTPSAKPKPTCSVDNDNDGIFNHLDLDSDGDGCPDVYEAGTGKHSNITTTSGTMQNGSGGVVTSSIVNSQAKIAAPYGANGFATGLQAAGNVNAYDSTYAYANATDTSIHSCCPQVSNNTIGSNQSFCGSAQPGILIGSTATIIPATTPSYIWLRSTTSGTAGFTVIPSQTSSNYLPGFLTQTTWFKRIVYASTCPSSADTSAFVVISINAKPDAGPDQNVCGNTTVMAGIGTGTWTQQGTTPAVANITAPSNNATTITGLNTEGIYNFIWTLNGCSDTMSVTVHAKPNAGTDKTICAGDTLTMNATGTGIWTQMGSTPVAATITTPANNNTTVTGMTTAGTYSFIWTVNGCTDTVAVLVKPMPNGSLTGNTICEGATGQLTFVQSSGTATFTLKINGTIYNNIQSGIPFAPNPIPTVTTNYNLEMITDSNGCSNTNQGSPGGGPN